MSETKKKGIEGKRNIEDYNLYSLEKIVTLVFGNVNSQEIYQVMDEEQHYISTFVKALPIEGGRLKYLISAFPSVSFQKKRAGFLMVHNMEAS